MKKIRFVFAALALFAIASSVTSCSKEKNIEPTKSVVDRFSTSQVNFTAESLTYNDFDMLNIVTGQAGNNNALPVIAEIAVNDLNTEVTHSRSSNMHPERYGVTQTMLITKVDETHCAISFIGDNNKMYAGSSNFQNGTSLPNNLLQNNVFDFQSYGNGNNDGSYTFDTNKLSGIYTVEEISTNGKPSGFTLTMETSTTKKIVLTLNNKLE
jgi:hypothetical protein